MQLVRQFQKSDEEEYIQLKLEMSFSLKEIGDCKPQTIWSDCEDGDFFEVVRSTEIYKKLCAHQSEILQYEIYMDETD
jgi:hypothetical protein